jgi:hypothetical protein
MARGYETKGRPPSNMPLNLSIPPQGHRSIIETLGTCGGLAG